MINNPIVFAKVKNPIFDYVTIEWFKPDQIYFSFRFEIFLNEIKFEKNQIECLFAILRKANLNICRSKKIFDSFKKASINLNELNGMNMIEAFKKSNEIQIGIDI